MNRLSPRQISGSCAVLIGLVLASRPVICESPLPQRSRCEPIEEFAIPVASAPTSIVAGPNGDLWFSGIGLGRTTTTGEITLIPIPGDPRTDALAFDTDGNLWFTEPFTNPQRIGRLAADGRITEATIPGTPPLTGIAIGSGGILYFVDSSQQQVGRFLGGLISPVRTSGLPGLIAADSDGNVWFTETGPRVGRIDQNGELTEFEIPVGNSSSNPGPITAGPDRAMWFILSFGDWIGRITNEGAITIFSPPRRNKLFVGMTAGPDGNVWFTETGIGTVFPPCGTPLDAVGQISADGYVTEIVLEEPGRYPAGIVSGSDGYLWVAEYYANRIARISPTDSCSRSVQLMYLRGVVGLCR